MKHYGLIFAAILFGVASTTPSSSQTTVPRQVMGSGGGEMKSPNHTANGTISQTTIGRAAGQGNKWGNIGFWYKTYTDRLTALVSIPIVQGSSGTQVFIPLILESSQNLVESGVRTFEATITFNGSLLEPTGFTPQCQMQDGMCMITITGETTDSAGTLAQLDFLAKLGSSESTPLTITDFRWLERDVKTDKQHGEFQLLDICDEGGHARLILSGESAAITSAHPNPASTTVAIDYSTNEAGIINLYLVDLTGKTVLDIYTGDADPGSYTLDVDVSAIASGRYFIILRTPTEMIAEPLEITQ